MVSKLNGPPLPVVERSISKLVSLSALSGQVRFIKAYYAAVAFKIVGGYQFLEWIGAEVGYVSLGEPSTITLVNGVQTITEAEIQGIAISAPFTIPVFERIGLYGKVGVYAWDRNNVNTGPQPSKTNADGVDPFWGGGFRWPISETTGISFEYERYLDVGDGNGISDVELFAMGLLWQF